MRFLEVRVLDSAGDADGGTVYRSLGTSPDFLELKLSPEAGDAAGRYAKILDLPVDRPSHAPSSPWLFVVGLDLEQGHESDFEDWYNIEHLPALAKVPGVTRATRFRRDATDGDNATFPAYLALYEIESPDIAGNTDWQAAVNTPWTERLRNHFQARWRGCYQLQPDGE